MYCPNCGSDIGNGKFCPNCGEAIETVEEPVKASPESVKTPEVQPASPGTTTKYSVNEFINKTMEKTAGTETFEMENNYLLNINLDGKVWAKKGAMVAYSGDVKFRREGTFERGLDTFVKKAVTGEASTLMKIKGNGKIYLADQGKEIIVLNLENEKIYVNGNDLLAFEDHIDWNITMKKSGGMMSSGGLFHVRLQGTGMIAITTFFTPITLLVTPEQPVYTDPQATVAWSGGLTPSFKADVDFKTLIGKDSGETFQMKFQGNGFVIVQPFEEY